jgi:glycosyltransferase involved in cell wall biosynthesis
VAFLLRFGVKPALCTIVQNTIDIEDITTNYHRYKQQAAAEREKLGLVEKTVILSVGHLRAAKRMDLLLDAFGQLRSVRGDLALLIVGDGPEMGRLQQRIRQDSLEDVFLLGEIVNNTGRYFAMSDVFVLPGDGGLAINEAMAFSLPVVCSEADGTEKDLIIDGKTGFLFKKGSVADLKAKLQLIISSKEIATLMGEAGFKHICDVASLSKVVEIFASKVLSMDHNQREGDTK